MEFIFSQFTEQKEPKNWWAEANMNWDKATLVYMNQDKAMALYEH
jgi:hypothetical protein